MSAAFARDDTEAAKVQWRSVAGLSDHPVVSLPIAAA